MVRCPIRKSALFSALCSCIAVASCSGQSTSNDRGSSGNTAHETGGDSPGSGGQSGSRSSFGGGLQGGGAGVSTEAAGAGASTPGGAAGQGEGDEAGGPTPSCTPSSQTRSSRSALSSGFSGSYQTDYYPLYSAVCSTVGDCATDCNLAGGTLASCAASECISGGTAGTCLPPTYWFGLDQLLVEGNSTDSSAWIIMVDSPYRDQLIAKNFQFEIPPGAIIQGIVFSLNESADAADAIADESVHVLQAGVPTSLDRGRSSAWTTDFQYQDYGGVSDLWGASWQADSINSSQFGIALTPMYLMTAGNAHAYVDFIRATVYFQTCS